MSKENLDVLRSDARHLNSLLENMARTGFLLSDLDPTDPSKRLGDEDYVSTRCEAFTAGLRIQVMRQREAVMVSLFTVAAEIIDACIVGAAVLKNDSVSNEAWEIIQDMLEEIHNTRPSTLPLKIDFDSFKKMIEDQEN